MEPETFEFSHRYSFESADDPERKVRLFRFVCGAGAYNLQHAYYWYREYDGLQPLGFAQPTFETKYENDDLIDGKLESVTVTGMSATTILVNSEFDPASLTVSAHSLWRGIGDAWSAGEWRFIEGDFVLVRYEVDPTFQPPGAESVQPEQPESYVVYDAEPGAE